jgi:transposase-like protein
MKKSTPQIEILELRFSMIEAKSRGRIREVIEARLEEELDAALGAGRHEHTEGRQGYRQGSKPAREVPVTGRAHRRCICRDGRL